MASLSADQRRAIRVRAASLYQRIADFVTAPEGPEPDDRAVAEASEVLRAWNQAFSPGNREAFARRLAWDNLSSALVVGALSRPEPDPDGPDWTVALDLVLEQAGAVLREFAAGNLPETRWFEDEEADDEPPFLEILVPVLRAARELLAELHPHALDRFGPSARRALEQALLKDVSPFAERSLYQLFEQVTAPSGNDSTAGPESAAKEPGGTARYQAFVASMLDEGLAPFFVAYPVLARIVSRLVDAWIETTAELAERLERDRRAIAETFCGGRDPGDVWTMTLRLSDPHHGRRRVAVLTFASGLSLVYKPRDVGLERALSDFLDWANAHGLEPRQRSLAVLERQHYGWVERAVAEEFDDEEQVRRYYRQAGGLTAIAYFLRGTDLHMENIVATRGGPVIVDAESLLQPARASAQESSPGVVHAEASEPCVATGMVTFAEVGADGERYETGGLRGEGHRGSSRPRRVWRSLRTDALHLATEHEFFAPSANRVLLGGASQRPESYLDDLCDGYTAAHRFFEEHRDAVLADDGPLAGFAGRRARVMFRPTNQYAVVQDVLAAPRYLESGAARSAAMDILARPFAMDTTRPVAWPLLGEEQRALEHLDIPHFTVEAATTAVWSGEVPLGTRFFTRPGLDLVRARLASLTEDTLAVQLSWLRRSLSETARSRFRTTVALPPPSSEDDTVRAQAAALASWIGSELMARAMPRGDALTWTMHRPGKVLTAAEEHFLYGGTLGPALFLAALGRVTGEPRWFDAAERAALPALRFAERADLGATVRAEMLGAGTGIGSIVYGLTLVGRLTGNPAHVEAAARVLRHIDRRRIEADRDLDVLAGSAGAILSALALPRDAAGDRALDVAVACGDHLIATQLHTHWGSNWPSRDGRLLAGFAHGAAGTAYALVRLYEVTGTRAYLDAALRAHRYERAVFSPAHGNWPLVRSAGHLPGNVAVTMTAWCHGAPGVGLARTMVSAALADEDPEITSEVNAALSTTAKLPGNAGDHVCCGNMGRADILLTAGTKLGRPDDTAAALRIASSAGRHAMARGRFQLVSSNFEHLVFDAGFFQGLSGIGYALLRIAAPDALPSVLAFETV